MLTSNPERHLPRFFRRLLGSLLAVSLVGACTLSDYNYLGAQRNSAAASGGEGGTSGAGTTSLPLAGNGGGVFTSSVGGVTSTNFTALGGASGAGGTGSLSQTGGATGAVESGGTTQVTSSTSVASGGVSTTGGTTNTLSVTTVTGGGTGGITNVAGGSAMASGGVSTGGVTNAAGSTAVASGGVSTGGVTNAAGSTAMATGGVSTGGVTNAAGSTAVASGGVSTGGASSGAGTGGAVPPSSCPGCAVLQVPFTASGQSARYLMLFPSSSAALTVNEHATTSTGGATSAPVTTEGTMKLRVYAPALGNTLYKLFVQQDSGSYTQCFSATKALPPEVSSGWITLEWGLGGCAADTSIGRLGFELVTDNATDASAPSSTTMWVDSIQIDLKGTTLAGPFSFDTSDTINPSVVTNDYEQTRGVLYLRPSGPTPPSGSTISWRNN